MNRIIENLKGSHLNGCNIVGALENALTSAINQADHIGGWSVKIDMQENEIFCFQHPDAGDGETILKF